MIREAFVELCNRLYSLGDRAKARSLLCVFRMKGLMRSTPLKRRRERELLIIHDFLCPLNGHGHVNATVKKKGLVSILNHHRFPVSLRTLLTGLPLSKRNLTRLSSNSAPCLAEPPDFLPNMKIAPHNTTHAPVG
jgi:hypothetical protein